MAGNYLRFAWRTLTRHKGYTLINVLGLSLGLCACIVIYTITNYEFSFDDFHPGKKQIYRVGGKVRENIGNEFATEACSEDIPPPTPAILRTDIPGLEAVAAFYPWQAAVTIKNTRYPPSSDATIITGNDYFHIFRYDWLAGNPAIALSAPYSVVLTENQARTYFGSLPPDNYLNKELIYDDSLHLHITGIVRDWTGNTDFPYTSFISFPTITHSFLRTLFHPDDWRAGGSNNQWVRTLVKLAPHKKADQVAAQLAGLIPRYRATDSFYRLVHFTLVLQPLADIHFNEAYFHDGIRKAHLPALYGLMGVASFILLLAIVNFINLSTAQSLRRAKEIGVRKILGGSRNQLILRFLTETAFITTLSALLALCFVQPVLTAFHSYIPEGLSFHPLHPQTLLFVLSVIMITTLMAGFYPARILAAYSPVVNLKNAGANKNTRQWIVRKGLIVFQYTVSLLFIIGSIVVGRQLHFMLDADMGFATDAVLTVNNYSAPQPDLQRFAEQAQHISGVQGLTLQGHAPAGGGITEFPVRPDGHKDKEMMVSVLAGDQHFLPFYHLTLLAGHNFPPGDSLNGFLINATYCRALGFNHPADAINHFLSINGQPSQPITGVVADFHENSLHETIAPLLIGHIQNLESSLALRLSAAGNGAAIKQTLSRLEATWKTVFPGQPFYWSFLDASIARLYRSEEQLAWLVQAATAVAIFISCMGLLGLVLFIVERKKKEISIRKVLGAGVTDIVIQLNKEFVLLLGIALLIATPVGWYGLHRWLQNYAYRIAISWWIFVLAGLAALVIAILTTAFRVISAALLNPVDHLRSD